MAQQRRNNRNSQPKQSTEDLNKVSVQTTDDQQDASADIIVNPDPVVDEVVIVPTTVADVDPTPDADKVEHTPETTVAAVEVVQVVDPLPTPQTTKVAENPFEDFLLGRNPGIDVNNPRLKRTISLMEDYIEKMGKTKMQSSNTIAVNQRQLYATLQYATEGTSVEAAACIDAVVWMIQRNLNDCFSARMRHRQGDGTIFTTSDNARLSRLVGYLTTVAEKNLAHNAVVSGVNSQVHTNLSSALSKTNFLGWMSRR